mmetsp:Transcript_24411/g.66282  ORF Transcript_24411/g.66282 Transcript_24411/m.66282 type:complete len:320 (+) Transcript_24411:277-1236(+)
MPSRTGAHPRRRPCSPCAPRSSGRSLGRPSRTVWVSCTVSSSTSASTPSPTTSAGPRGATASRRTTVFRGAGASASSAATLPCSTTLTSTATSSTPSKSLAMWARGARRRSRSSSRCSTWRCCGAPRRSAPRTSCSHPKSSSCARTCWTSLSSTSTTPSTPSPWLSSTPTSRMESSSTTTRTSLISSLAYVKRWITPTSSSTRPARSRRTRASSGPRTRLRDRTRCLLMTSVASATTWPLMPSSLRAGTPSAARAPRTSCLFSRRARRPSAPRAGRRSPSTCLAPVKPSALPSPPLPRQARALPRASACPSAGAGAGAS